MRTAIIGGGAAGLSLALMLDGDVTVFEKDATPGGLCRSVEADGFVFDQGPHILGGIPEAVDWIVGSVGEDFAWHHGHTLNRAWLDGRLCSHPFEDSRDVERYMRKLWKRWPKGLSISGLGAQAGREPGGVAEFRYPLAGGYQTITGAWADRLGDRVVLEHAHFGESIPKGYDRVVITTPQEQAAYNDLVTVTCGFRGERPDLTAVYVPSRRSPFHRVSFPATFSLLNAPVGCYSLQAEASCRAGGHPEENEGAYVAAALALFADLGHADAPLMTDFRVARNAYPVPTLQVDPAPLPPNVYRHGRTGSHAYVNLDGVVAQSMALAAALNGVPPSYGPGDDLA